MILIDIIINDINKNDFQINICYVNSEYAMMFPRMANLIKDDR